MNTQMEQFFETLQKWELFLVDATMFGCVFFQHFNMRKTKKMPQDPNKTVVFLFKIWIDRSAFEKHAFFPNLPTALE